MRKWELGMENSLNSRILYCDANCVVVNKMAGEAVEGAGKGMIDLPKILAAQMPGLNLPPAEAQDALAIPSAVHRLDVPVTGCAAFARTENALRFLNDAFRNETVNKRYWAIIEPPPEAGVCQWLENPSSEFTEIVHWIQFNSQKNKSFAHDEQGGERKKAVLRCRLAGRGRDYLFLEIDLVTGRHHQIRAQFEKMGLHIKGDLKYGARRSEKEGGICLHARLLSFPSAAKPGDSPLNAPKITVQADPPVMNNLWQAFITAVGETSPIVLTNFPK
jgi:23S rRNA pseudouridine1911/1915/1917 synthase